MPTLKVDNPANIFSGYLKDFLNLHLVSGDIQKLSVDMSAFTVSDDEIKKRIQRVKADKGLVVCPHTATAFEVLERENLNGSICVATAHPAKFPETVEPLIQEEVPIPSSLQKILNKESRVSPLLPELGDLDRLLSL